MDEEETNEEGEGRLEPPGEVRHNNKVEEVRAGPIRFPPWDESGERKKRVFPLVNPNQDNGTRWGGLGSTLRGIRWKRRVNSGGIEGAP